MKKLGIYAMGISLLVAAPAMADTFELTWYTADGGGATFSTGGGYQLGGSIGQPDASVAMSGGTITLVGGFWPGVPMYAPGDLNCDGSVNFKDINPFVLYLSNFSGWQTANPGCPAQNGDINQDGTYPSFKDINPFVALLSGRG